MSGSVERGSIDRIVINSIYAESPKVAPKSARDFVNKMNNLNKGLIMMGIRTKKDIGLG